MSGIARISVRGLKVQQLIDPRALLVPGLVAPDGQPAGSPILEIALEGTPLVVHAMLPGKSVRRAIKAINEHGTDGVHCIVQGNLTPGATPGAYVLDCAGVAVQPRVAKEKAEAVA